MTRNKGEFCESQEQEQDLVVVVVVFGLCVVLLLTQLLF